MADIFTPLGKKEGKNLEKQKDDEGYLSDEEHLMKEDQEISSKNQDYHFISKQRRESFKEGTIETTTN